MSTRATVHFCQDGQAEAIVYRHPDGYPEGLGKDLLDFLQEVQGNCGDTRFYDPSYLAAKWVVRDSQRYAKKHEWVDGKHTKLPAHPLDFISVGIVLQDPSDIEYRYYVNCDLTGLEGVVETLNGARDPMPLVEVEGVRYSGEGVNRQPLADVLKEATA